MRNAIALASLAAVAAAATPASAREVDRQEIAERFAPDVPQEQSLFCRDTRVVTLLDGSEFRACINWRAQNKTRVIRTYIALDGPEDDTNENLDLARDCFDIAVASQNAPYRETFNEGAFLIAAKAQFEICSRTKGLKFAKEYTLTTYDTGVWLGAS